MNDYTLGIKELDNAIEGIKKGSNIMLMGPPMSGKEVILYQIMYNGAINGNAIINVTTNESANHILERFKEKKLELPLDRIGIIDCTKNPGIAVTESENIKIASSPVDLTGIGVKISQFFDEFLIKKKIQKNQLHINSLSTILMYSNIQISFRFLHIHTGRIKSAGALGIYLVDRGMHDEKTLAILKQLFDGIIEIESENYKNFIRIIGLSSKPSPWFEYEVEGANLKIIIIGKKC
jgi:KaiC/GvpD/RAD55 family RecA-like ATPase